MTYEWKSINTRSLDVKVEGQIRTLEDTCECVCWEIVFTSYMLNELIYVLRCSVRFVILTCVALFYWLFCQVPASYKVWFDMVYGV